MKKLESRCILPTIVKFDMFAHMKLSAPLALFILLVASCNNPPPSSQRLDSAHLVKEAPTSAIDTAIVGVTKMLRYFRTNDSGVVDPNAEIDKDYIIKIFNDTDRLWDHISSINPVAVTRNPFGTFFIVQLNCAAGGVCKEFYLIGFAHDQPLPPEPIGSNLADADFLKTFDYHIAGDSAIVVTTENYDESSKRTDSSVIRYPLRIQKSRLVVP